MGTSLKMPVAGGGMKLDPFYAFSINTAI